MVFNLKRKRADFKDKRFVDSGVWMGSDESLRDSPSEDMLWEGQPGSKNEHWPVAAQSRAVFKGIEEPEEHKVARAIVLECLEKGQDSVDLRYVGVALLLFSLPSMALASLVDISLFL